MERLWRLRDIAESFDVNYYTLWRWTRSGKMPTVKLPGGALRVKDSELRRILGEEKEPIAAV